MMPEKLRKAALLISTLDERSADALLEQMPDEQAAQIRRAMMNLREVDPNEQEQVIREFMRRPVAVPPPTDAGVELDSSLLARMRSPLPPPAPDIASMVPFQFLHEAATDELGRLLRHEHPQIAAVVMSHLPPRKTAEILAGYPTDLQTDILRRIADLEAADAEVLHDLEKELQTRLAGRLSGRRSAGLQAVRDILDASEGLDRRVILQHLRRRDQELADRLAPRAATNHATPTATPDVTATAIGPHNKPIAVPAPSVPSEPPTSSAPPARPAPSPSTPDIDDTSDDEPRATRPVVRFDDVMRLANHELAHLIRAAEPQLTLLALAGARPDFVQRLLGQLPAREARTLRRKMEQMRPLLLSDVEIAQQRLADVAASLVARGTIQLPSVQGFAAAA